MRKFMIVVMSVLLIASGLAFYNAIYIVAIALGCAFLISLVFELKHNNILKYLRGWARIQQKDILKKSPMVVYEAESLEARKKIASLRNIIAANASTLAQLEKQEKDIVEQNEILCNEINVLKDTNIEMAQIKAVRHSENKKILEKLREDIKIAQSEVERSKVDKERIDSMLAIRLNKLHVTAIRANSAAARKEAYAMVGDKSSSWNLNDSQDILDESVIENESVTESYSMPIGPDPKKALEDFLAENPVK